HLPRPSQNLPPRQPHSASPLLRLQIQVMICGIAFPGCAAASFACRLPGNKDSVSISEQLPEFAASYPAAWSSQTPASVAAFYATNGWLTINGGPRAQGRTALTREAQAFMIAFPDMRVSFDRLVESDDFVQFHWTLTGTYTGPGGTGKRVQISGYEEWRLSPEGLIAESCGNFDAAEYQRQLQHGAD